MILRRLGPEDWRAFRDVRLAALRDSAGAFFRSLAEEEAQPEAYWRELLALDTAALFGVFDGEALVGITGVFTDRDDPSGRTAALGMTWLAPVHRGRGVGHRFYAARLAWAREHGFARVAVGHRASNEPSRRTMLAAGFREVGRTPHQWPDGGSEDHVDYELMLDPSASVERS